MLVTNLSGGKGSKMKNAYLNAEYVLPNEHSMKEKSLERYLEIKINPILLTKEIDEIIVVGEYKRSDGVLLKEKNNKLFNYKRPTVEVVGNEDKQKAIVYCYPR